MLPKEDRYKVPRSIFHANGHLWCQALQPEKEDVNGELFPILKCGCCGKTPQNKSEKNEYFFCPTCRQQEYCSGNCWKTHALDHINICSRFRKLQLKLEEAEKVEGNN